MHCRVKSHDDHDHNSRLRSGLFNAQSSYLPSSADPDSGKTGEEEIDKNVLEAKETLMNKR